MRSGFHAVLADRAVLHIGGPDATTFLQNVITTDMEAVGGGRAGFGALLSPQGKILADFLILPADEGYWFDLPAAQLADFMKRMTLYRLRAKVTIRDESAGRQVVAFWGGEPPELAGALPDPRLAGLGWRAVVERDIDPASLPGEAADEAAYHAHRIALGVPEGGRDFAFGDAFPHDADMDDLGGLDFRKGCYVGQEIVSRMQHRGTARRRAVPVTSGAELPPAGTAIEAAGRPIGALGSSAGGRGIALIRLDRARRALDEGIPLVAGGATIVPELPAFAHFTWPAAGGEDEGAA